MWRSPAALSLCAECGTGDPVAAIRRTALALVADSGLERPARNLPLLASLQDIVAIQALAMADAGRLIPTERGMIVHVNAGHAAAKRRFSACHEIAHTLIPDFGPGDRRRADASTGLYSIDLEEEYLCDVGASELLLPTDEFTAALGGSPPSMEALIALAADFGASFEATAIKLVRHGAGDMGLIVWEPGLKPTQLADMAAPSLFDERDVPAPARKLRVRYACCSGMMMRHFFPKDKSIADDSLVGQAYTADGSVCGPQEIATGKGPHIFRTESMGFQFWNGATLERKVLSLVFPV